MWNTGGSWEILLLIGESLLQPSQYRVQVDASIAESASAKRYDSPR